MPTLDWLTRDADVVAAQVPVTSTRLSHTFSVENAGQTGICHSKRMATAPTLAPARPETRRRPNFKLAQDAALGLLSQFDVQDPPVNPVLIARRTGVEVVFASFEAEAEDVSGFYDYEERKIFVNRDEPALRQTFTVAHELGHQILHSDWVATDAYRVYRRGNQVQDEHETEANFFAANLLMPRFLMNRFYDLPVPDLSQMFAVSVPAVKARLQTLYGI